MPAEGLPERIRDVVGPKAARELPARFDPDDPLHLDHAARLLLDKLYAEDDGTAWRCLVDLTLARVLAIAQDTVADLGLLLDPEALAGAFYSRLLLDRRQRGDVHHFLAAAADELQARAEGWLRDVACMEMPEGARTPVSSSDPRRPGDMLDQVFACKSPHELALMLCFHRLAAPDRRLLRAVDVDGLELDEVAAELDLPLDDVDEDLHAARHRLDDAVERALNGGEG